MNNPFIVTSTEPQTSLDELARALQAAKEQLTRAQAAVLNAESAIVSAVGSEDEGSLTVRSDSFKITTTQPVNRSVDKEALEAIRREFPEDLFEAMFDFKPSLNVKLFKECQHLRPEVYALACKAVTSKAGKIAVKVEALSESNGGAA
jgi:hypothetical protein